MIPAAALAALLCVPVSSQESTPKPFTRKEIREAKKNPLKYTIDEATIKLEDLGPVVVPSELPGPGKPTDDDGLILDRIVNIGLKLWAIIKENQPVADVKNLYATALPSGARRWDDLAGWTPPMGRIYQLTAKNMYGSQTILCRFQVLRSWGGSVNGKGRYLTGVTVEPLKVEVAWGYQFTFDVEAPDSGILNVGDSENPVAGMTINARWKIHTVMKHSEGRALYYLDGKGAFRELGLSNAQARIESALQKALHSLE